MTHSDLSRDVVEELAEEFLDRYRNGECPPIEEYARRVPERAEEIRELFPTIAALEGFKVQTEQSFDEHLASSFHGLKKLGEFELLREIGRGGMGVVYEAEQPSLQRRVAVKLLQRQLTADDEQRNRFRREALTVAMLQHTNIVPVYGVGEQEELQYYVMPYIRGIGLNQVVQVLHQCTLAEQEFPEFGELVEKLLREQQPLIIVHEGNTYSERSIMLGHATTDWESVADEANKNGGSSLQSSVNVDSRSARESKVESQIEATGPIDNQKWDPTHWRNVARLGMQVASALRYAHEQGIVHRDIKPGNLLLDANETVWVTDFGLAKAMESGELTGSGDIMGTLRYMAPERFSGESDARGDLYGLGATLYELAVLKPAFQAESQTQLLHKVTHAKPIPPRKIREDLPRDLETIILKAMAGEVEQRYQTADELHDDLQRFLEGRPILARRSSLLERFQRWTKRNPAIASLTALSLVLMFIVALVATKGYLQTQASLASEKLEREKTEQSLDLSLELLDKLYQQYAPDDLNEMAKVEIKGEDGRVQSVPVRPEITPATALFLRELSTFYDRLGELDSENAELQSKAALALRRLGDIHQELGDDQAAVKAYQSAQERFQKLGEKLHGSEIGKIQTELGNVFSRLEDPDRAKEAYQSALATLLAENQNNSSADARYQLARTYYFLGKRNINEDMNRPDNRRPDGPPPHPGQLLGQRPGPPPERKLTRGEQQDYLNRAIDILNLLRTESSTVPEYQYLLALCCRERVEDFRGEDATTAIRLLGELSQKYPTVPKYRHALGEAYALPDPRHLEDSSAQTLEAAAAQLVQALAQFKQLRERFSDSVKYQISEVHASHKLGTIYLHQARNAVDSEAKTKLFSKAETHLRNTLEFQTRYAEKFPDQLAQQLWLSRIQLSLSHLLVESNNNSEALALLENAWEKLQNLQQKNPQQLSPTYNNIGHMLADILKETGEFERSREIRDELFEASRDQRPPLNFRPPRNGPPENRPGDFGPGRRPPRQGFDRPPF